MKRFAVATKMATTLLLVLEGSVLANGGPFVIKYPKGDPAAKGVLARLDPSLKPKRETRLRVVREDLKMVFTKDRSFGRSNSLLSLNGASGVCAKLR